MSTKERVIIDTDPGVDDVMALFFTLAHENIIVEGITTVMGNNNDLDILARNACKVLELCPGNLSVPVYKGSSKPLKTEYIGQRGMECHGKNGLGNISIEEPKNLHLIVKDVPAEQFIVDTCTKYPKEVTILALGTHTNLAKAILLQPDLKNYVKRIYCMGGSFLYKGNVSPVAEANIYDDPDAAKIVFQSGIEITMAPLDVTAQAHLDPTFRDEIRTLGKIGQFIYDISQHYVDKIVEWGIPINLLPIHDSCAVMAFVCPEVFTEVARLRVEVETLGEFSRGQTIADWSNVWKKEPQTTILLKLDQKKFKEYYLSKLSQLVQRGIHS